MSLFDSHHTAPVPTPAGCATLQLDDHTLLVFEPSRTATGQPGIHIWAHVNGQEQAGVVVPATMYGPFVQATLGAFLAATEPPRQLPPSRWPTASEGTP